MTFDPDRLTPYDRAIAGGILGGDYRLARPDLDIQPDGTPYLYRWHVTPRGRRGNVYFHVQVASDPERPLHDHPWDNQSVILSGGYLEHFIRGDARWCPTQTRRVVKGDTVQRKAAEAHRLELLKGVPYTMTLFTTGPTIRDWGFWCSDHRARPVWVSHLDCISNTEDGKSIFVHPQF